MHKDDALARRDTEGLSPRQPAASADLGVTSRNPPVLSKYHGLRGFELERFIADYEAWTRSHRDSAHVIGDLVTALKRLRDLDVDCSQEQDREAWAFAHAAIAKAEGSLSDDAVARKVDVL